MNVAFRVDASLTMGSGHVMRCLTLANGLAGCGADVVFICRELPGNHCAMIETQGFSVLRLPPPLANVSSLEWNAHARWLEVDWEQDALEAGEALGMSQVEIDWLIVDHYALDSRWERRLRGQVDRIMVIDDLADRPHDCDLLLDQNLYQVMEQRYQQCVPAACKQLLGPEYTLLRSEFLEARKRMTMRSGAIRTLLVFLGGSDPGNSTMTVLEALGQVSIRGIQIDVVIGASNPFRDSLEEFCAARESISLSVQASNMAELMADADLMIGAGGVTTWERCCLGLPSLILSIAENQVEIARTVDEQGAAWYLGSRETVSSAEIVSALEDLIDNPSRVQTMSANAKRLVDGLGARRVVEEFFEKC